MRNGKVDRVINNGRACTEAVRPTNVAQLAIFKFYDGKFVDSLQSNFKQSGDTFNVQNHLLADLNREH